MYRMQSSEEGSSLVSTKHRKSQCFSNRMSESENERR